MLAGASLGTVNGKLDPPQYSLLRPAEFWRSQTVSMVM
jgi:hypothetical protein